MYNTNQALDLTAFPAHATRQMHVLRHDSDPFGVNRAHIRVLEETDEVRLTGLLHCEYSGGLET